MCGIAGIIKRSSGNEPSVIESSLKAMLDIQAHRGPDDKGDWLGLIDDTWIAIGHRRLAVIDLSQAGHQPMLSPCGEYILVYNGELYNYLELREELEKKGCVFKSDSDTEVLLQSLIRWGEQAFDRFNGMWALALLNLEKRCLILSRDRFGEKPLYYYGHGDTFYFASEIKAICKASQECFEVNKTVAGRFLGQSLLEAQDETFFKGIKQVPAASYLVVNVLGDYPVKGDSPKYYWSYPEAKSREYNSVELIENIRDVFIDSVRIRLRSDVPVGVLLSGGIDSSAITSAMHQLNSGGQVNILSAVSDDADYDEQPFIDAMARYLNRSVHKIKLEPSPQEAFARLEKAIWVNDEPIGSFSAVAHMMLMEKARDLGITVILSGQGGDELLCGYLKYHGFYLRSLLMKRQFFDLMKVVCGVLKPPMSYLSDFRLSDAKRYLPAFIQPRPDKIFGPALQEVDWKVDIGHGSDPLQKRQALDMERFSVPALTHYEDRMSMLFAREIRLPFLDYRLAELLLPLEPEWKLHGGWTKWVFRQAMTGMLPPNIVWRRDKKGFSNPLVKWLKNEWRENIEELLASRMITEELGLINKTELKKLYLSYCEGRNPWLSEKDIFNPVGLEIWARQYRSYLS